MIFNCVYMGICFKKNKFIIGGQSVTIEGFIKEDIIGLGGFGKVWKVINKQNKIIYAMKVISKTSIFKKNTVSYIIKEKSLLENLENKF